MQVLPHRLDVKKCCVFCLIILIYINVRAQGSDKIKSYEAHSEMILGIAQSPNGEYLLSASDDNTAILWDKDGKYPIHVQSQQLELEQRGGISFEKKQCSQDW
jgi:WD40 repeat protein